MIPQANPQASYNRNKKEIDDAINKVLDSGWYIFGDNVKIFEKNFSKYLDVPYSIGLASGTDAILFALKAIGVKRGDKVITTTHTANATVSAIEWLGAKPILVDEIGNPEIESNLVRLMRLSIFEIIELEIILNLLL